jgi:hypothetical protein
MHRPSHSSRFYHPHNIGWGVQIIKLFIMKFYPPPCYLVLLQPKYSPQYPNLKHPQPSLQNILQTLINSYRNNLRREIYLTAMLESRKEYVVHNNYMHRCTIYDSQHTLYTKHNMIGK